MPEVYTAAIWNAKPGREEDFIALWETLAERTLESFPTAAGTLLRDRARPQRFMSFGAWDSVDEVERWRSSPAFQQTVGELQDVLESFDPATWDVAARAGHDAL